MLQLADGHEHRVDYEPGESTSGLFGGNSNWRGPIWFPSITCSSRPSSATTTSTATSFRSNARPARAAAQSERGGREIWPRGSAGSSCPTQTGRRPCHGDDAATPTTRIGEIYMLFYEYFHGDTGRGLGASHQTGWTALVVPLLRDVACPSRMEKTASARPPARRKGPRVKQGNAHHRDGSDRHFTFEHPMAENAGGL